LEKDFRSSSVLDEGKVDSPLLLLGLIYREVSRSMEMEPTNPTKAPVHLVNSSFGIKEVNLLEKLISKVVLPSMK
jgi:hypothetical protein